MQQGSLAGNWSVCAHTCSVLLPEWEEVGHGMLGFFSFSLPGEIIPISQGNTNNKLFLLHKCMKGGSWDVVQQGKISIAPQSWFTAVFVLIQ